MHVEAAHHGRPGSGDGVADAVGGVAGHVVGDAVHAVHEGHALVEPVGDVGEVDVPGESAGGLAGGDAAGGAGDAQDDADASLDLVAQGRLSTELGQVEGLAGEDDADAELAALAGEDVGHVGDLVTEPLVADEAVELVEDQDQARIGGVPGEVVADLRVDLTADVHQSDGGLEHPPGENRSGALPVDVASDRAHLRVGAGGGHPVRQSGQCPGRAHQGQGDGLAGAGDADQEAVQGPGRGLHVDLGVAAVVGGADGVPAVGVQGEQFAGGAAGRLQRSRLVQRHQRLAAPGLRDQAQFLGFHAERGAQLAVVDAGDFARFDLREDHAAGGQVTGGGDAFHADDLAAGDGAAGAGHLVRPHVLDAASAAAGGRGDGQAQAARAGAGDVVHGHAGDGYAVGGGRVDQVDAWHRLSDRSDDVGGEVRVLRGDRLLDVLQPCLGGDFGVVPQAHDQAAESGRVGGRRVGGRGPGGAGDGQRGGHQGAPAKCGGGLPPRAAGHERGGGVDGPAGDRAQDALRGADRAAEVAGLDLAVEPPHAAAADRGGGGVGGQRVHGGDVGEGGSGRSVGSHLCLCAHRHLAHR